MNSSFGPRPRIGTGDSDDLPGDDLPVGKMVSAPVFGTKALGQRPKAAHDGVASVDDMLTLVEDEEMEARDQGRGQQAKALGMSKTLSTPPGAGVSSKALGMSKTLSVTKSTDEGTSSIGTTSSRRLMLPQSTFTKTLSGRTFFRPSVGQQLTLPESGKQAASREKEMLEQWQSTMSEDTTRKRFALMLKKLKIFRDSSLPFLEMLATKLHPHEYAEEENIMTQGDYGDWLCICMKGCCSVMVKDEGKRVAAPPQKVGEFRPGKYCGEMAMLGISLKRMATITADKPTLVLSLSRDDLEQTLITLPWEAEKWEHILCEPLHIEETKLKDTKFFKDLSAVFVNRIQKHLQVKLFYKDEYLMKEGDYGCEMYVLRRGTVGIFKGKGTVKEHLIDISNEGIIGEMAVLGADRRSASVQCKSLCVLQVLHGDVFNHILDQYPEEHSKFDEHVMKRLVGLHREKLMRNLKDYDEFYGKVHPNREMMKKLQDSNPNQTRPISASPNRTSSLASSRQRPATAGGNVTPPSKPRTCHIVCQGIPNLHKPLHETVQRPATAPSSTRAPGRLLRTQRTMGFTDKKAVADYVSQTEAEYVAEDREEDLQEDGRVQTADQMYNHAVAHRHDHDNDEEWRKAHVPYDANKPKLVAQNTFSVVHGS